MIMGKGLQWHKRSRVLRIAKVIYRRFVRGLRQFFFSDDLSISVFCPQLLPPEALSQIPDVHALLALQNRIELLLHTGFRVQVSIKRGQITDGVIGYLTVRRGAKLEWQEEILMQSEVIEKKSLCYRRIDLSAEKVVLTDFDNTQY